MPEPTPVAEEVVAPVVETPAEESKKTKVRPMNPNKQLSGQVDNLLRQLPKEEDVKPDKDSPKEEPAPTKEEVEELPAKEEPAETPEEEPDNYREPVELPAEDKYILDNLPTIQTIGHVGEAKDKVVRLKVGVRELPDGFEFADKATELQFMQDVAAQELTARQLQTNYRQQVRDNEYQSALTQQAVDVASDVKSLQDEGHLDKFQYDENDPKFNDDPAVKEANAIYKVFEDTNKKYAREGRTYRVTFRDAADKYYAAKFRSEAKETKKVVETPPSKEREEVATKVSAPQGAKPGNPRKGAYPGMTSSDIVRLVNRGVI